jgi:F-type H+-transporting ATPase subunit a
MGDHDTWYTLLPFWHDLEATFAEGLRRDWRAAMFQDTQFTLIHVMGALIAVAIILYGTAAYRRTLAGEDKGIIPPRSFGMAAVIDGLVGAVYKLSVDAMGEEDARRYLPFIGTLALFIFFSNIQGVIPGFLPPTDTLKTNLALAGIVFVAYNALGVYRNGLAYLEHFLGPKIGGFPWLFPLMLPIEIISHFARPLSLSLRLMGNILADHKVLLAVSSLIALLVPVPFLMLGVLVSIVQTMVFTLLTIIYIAMAVEHHDEHHDEHEPAHGH